MRLFRRKKNYSIDDLNKINQERWKNIDVAEQYRKSQILQEIQSLRDANVDEDVIEQYMLSHGLEGKNVDENGKEYWLCGHCSSIIKFNTREEYISHHFRVHG